MKFNYKNADYSLLDYIGISDPETLSQSIKTGLCTIEGIKTEVWINGSLSYYSDLDLEDEEKAIKKPFKLFNEDLNKMTADECISSFENSKEKNNVNIPLPFKTAQRALF